MADSGEKRYGQDVQNLIDGILASNNYEKLNETVRSTIDTVFDEIGIDKGAPHRVPYGTDRSGAGNGKYAYGGGGQRQAGGAGRGAGRAAGTAGRNAGPAQAGRRASAETFGDTVGHWAEEGARGVRKAADVLSRTASEYLRKNEAPDLYTSKPPGEVSGMAAAILGGLLTFGNITALIVLALTTHSMALIIFFLFLTGVTGWVTYHFGIRPRARNRRFRTYINTLAGRKYCSIGELAASVEKSEEYTAKDLRDMISHGLFRQAHVDPAGKTFMLDNETYQLFLQADSAYRAREAEKARKEQAAQTSAGAGARNEELEAAISSGEEYIRKLREANEAISGEEISGKLDRLEIIMQKIFALLRQQPKLLPKLRRFMNYYMPMTDKLVQTYRVLDEQPVAGENIQKARKEIEDTLDTIIEAYEKLFDSFFEEAAMDVTSDISVLQNLMAQDGLTNQPFRQSGAGAAAVQEETHE